MYSLLLEKKGLYNSMGGKTYNFKMMQGLTAVEEAIITLTDTITEDNQGIYHADQVHGDQIAYVSQKGERDQVTQISGVDGLMTDVPGLALIIKFADCTPIVIYDPVRKVQASLHSGWRSTLKQISRKALTRMVEDFHCRLEDMAVYVGPTIDQDHYEVGAEVYQAFEDFPDWETFFKPGVKEGKYQMSMKAANLALLKAAGIEDRQIEVSPNSTFTNLHLHSARRDGPDYGLNAIVTMIPNILMKRR